MFMHAVLAQVLKTVKNSLTFNRWANLSYSTDFTKIIRFTFMFQPQQINFHWMLKQNKSFDDIQYTVYRNALFLDLSLGSPVGLRNISILTKWMIVFNIHLVF